MTGPASARMHLTETAATKATSLGMIAAKRHKKSQKLRIIPPESLARNSSLVARRGSGGIPALPRRATQPTISFFPTKATHLQVR